MPKRLGTYDNLQKAAQRELDRIAPDAHLTAVLEWKQAMIQWSDGVGRAPWRCGILPRADVPIGDLRSRLNTAMAVTRASYDLGFTAN